LKKRFFVVSATSFCLGLFVPCSLFADFEFNVPQKLQPLLQAQLESGGEAWIKSDFPVSQGIGKISEKQFSHIWFGLGNAALRFHLYKKAEDFMACRKSLMALCSYKKWFDLEHELLGTDAVWPVVAVVYSKALVQSECPETEKQQIRHRLHLQLLKYDALCRGESSVPWWEITNHPDRIPHLLAMTLLALDEAGHDDKLSKRVLDEVLRQCRRTYSLAEEQTDGAGPFGVLQGLRADWARLALASIWPKADKDPFMTLDWAKRRQLWYEAITLPGQTEFWSDGGETCGPMSSQWVPLLAKMAAITKNEHLQHFALEATRALRTTWTPWLFLSALWADEGLKEDVDHHAVFQTFPSQGWMLGREHRRRGGAFLSFHCGNPVGEPWHKAWLAGRPDLDLSNCLPDQGSWTLRWDDRVILGATPSETSSTMHFNTLLVGDEGQLFEGYPRYRPEELKRVPLGGKLMLNERYGNSWLLMGEYSNSYSNTSELKKFYRVLLWLSPSMVIQLDHVKCDKAKDLKFFYNSPNYPLALHKDGFYQKVTGMQMRSTSFPQGVWSVDYRRDQEGRDVAVAKESVMADTWDRCCLLANLEVQSDTWIERVQTGVHMDFYKGMYRLDYQFEDDQFRLKMQVGEKVFFDVKQDL
jgi:hypothetical protein